MWYKTIVNRKVCKNGLVKLFLYDVKNCVLEWSDIFKSKTGKFQRRDSVVIYFNPFKSEVP